MTRKWKTPLSRPEARVVITDRGQVRERYRVRIAAVNGETLAVLGNLYGDMRDVRRALLLIRMATGDWLLEDAEPEVVEVNQDDPEGGAGDA